MSPRVKEINNLRNSILGFFLEKPYHGYELYKQIRQTQEYQQIWYIKQGLFYSHLEALFSEGYLTQNIFEGSQYPDRKVYEITEAGRSLFFKWLREPVRHGREMRQEFLVKLYFALRQSPAVRAELIENQRAECRRWIQEINQEQQNQDGLYQQLVFQYRIMQITAMIDWLDFVELHEKQLVGGK